LGGGGGVVLPRDPDVVSSKAGSSPSRDLGGVSTVELRGALAPGRDGTAADGAGESWTGYSGSDVTALVELALGTSEEIAAPGSQLVHGADTRAGVV
jgi:hypothetical protein